MKKKDSHVTYLKAQLEGFSLVEEDQKVYDDAEGKGAKV